MASPCQLLLFFFEGGVMFKINLFNCCGLDVHKTWIYACIGITDANGLTQYHEQRFSAFTNGLQELVAFLVHYNCKDVCMESSGKYWIPVFNILEPHVHVVLAHPKYTKPQKGNKTDRKDARWICDLFACGMIKPSFIPPKDIRNLRDLVRYRFKLGCMVTSEKSRALNCLTVSNLKLDDCFSDVFGKSSRSILQQLLDHPGQKFDVSAFVDPRCKASLDDINAGLAGEISAPQATKLKQCLAHIDELETHRAEIEKKIEEIAAPYHEALELIRTIPGFNSTPFSAIAILSEIGTDMSVFPTAKHLCSWAGVCPHNDQSARRVKSNRISKAGNYLKPLLVQISLALTRKKKTDLEFRTRYRKLKARRGHNKAIIAVCRMLLTAIWHILSDRKPYTPDGYMKDRQTSVRKEMTIREAVKMLKARGFIIKDDPLPA